MVKHKNKRWRIKTADGGKGKDYQEEDVNGYMFLALQDAGALVVMQGVPKKCTFRMLLEPQCIGSITICRHPLCLEIDFLVVTY